MTRGEGFEIADTDTGMLADPKVLALARRLHDSTRTLAAVGLYDAVRLASWKAGRRLTLDETMPGWCLDPMDDLAAHLVAVGLLDAEERIPGHAWIGWYGPANERREDRRRSGQIGGLRNRGGRTLAEAMALVDSTATASLKHRQSADIPDRPSVPTDRPLPGNRSMKERTTERPTSDPRSLADILAAMAPSPTPTGATP